MTNRSTLWRFLALLLSELIAILPLGATTQVKPYLSPVVYQTMKAALERPYLELFETAAGLEFNAVLRGRSRALCRGSETG